MAYLPKKSYPKFEVEIYPTAFQSINHSTKWYRLFSNPINLWNNSLNDTHFKIINEIPEYIHSFGTGQYYFKDGVYRLSFKCSRRWQISQTLPTSLPNVSYRSSGASESIRGKLTRLGKVNGSVVDTGNSAGTGYRVANINFSQLVQVYDTVGKTYGVDFHLPGLGSYDTTDSKSTNIYKWVSTLELIEGKTTSSSQI